MEPITEKAFPGTRQNTDLSYSFLSSGAKIGSRENPKKSLLMVRRKRKGSAFCSVGAFTTGWLKAAKAPLPLRIQVLFEYRASQFNRDREPL